MVMTSRTITEDMVRAVEAPIGTDTWKPLSHGFCLDVLDKCVKDIDVKIGKRFYSLSKDGKVMAGAWTIEGRSVKKYASTSIYPAIIFHNSINKIQSFGINGGTDSWICENLCIMGQYTEFRKHTSHYDQLEITVKRALEVLLPSIEEMVEYHIAMREVKLETSETKVLAYDAIQKNIIPRKEIKKFDELLFGEQHRYDPHQLFGFHGACTELMRDNRMCNDLTFGNKQKNLNFLIVNRFGDQLPKYPGREVFEITS